MCCLFKQSKKITKVRNKPNLSTAVVCANNSTLKVNTFSVFMLLLFLLLIEKGMKQMDIPDE